MKLCVIKLKNNQYKVTDYFKKLPTSPCKSYSDALDLCRCRFERTIYEEIYELKVPFIGLWLVW